MRRPSAAILGTLAGTALLVGAKLGTQPVSNESIKITEDAATGAEPTAAASAQSWPTTPPSALGSNPSTTGRPAPSATAGATTAPTSGTRLRAGTFPGTAVTHKYGTLRVTITASSGRISAITESYATSLPVSEQINKDALPKLRQEALAAQSARIDTVSGATYTSDAYRSSLQAAIDRAKG